MTDGAIIVRVNGASSASLLLTDRGLHYGDGVFETMRFSSGRISFLALHLERLYRSLRTLGIALPSDRINAELKQVCAEVVSERLGDAVIKLIVTRGRSARGYNPANATNPMPVILVYPYHAQTDLRKFGIDKISNTSQ